LIEKFPDPHCGTSGADVSGGHDGSGATQTDPFAEVDVVCGASAAAKLPHIITAMSSVITAPVLVIWD